jgi:hypothetical protein
VLKSKEYIASKKAKKREDNAKRYNVFKRALNKKEKWAISRAKMKAKSFQKFAAKEVLKHYEDKKKIEIAKATEELGKNLKT